MPSQPIASSSSSSSYNSQPKRSRRKWSKEQLLRSLEILSAVTNPLPSELPPSPPASRSSSPNPGSKRKLEPSSESESTKRSRTVSQADRSSHHSQHLNAHPPAPTPQQHSRPPPNTSNSMRSEPTEDGEVREDSFATPSGSKGLTTVVSNPVPVRRPRRGWPPIQVFDEIHDKYHHSGRMLKYSGDARFWSTYPSTHKEYRPLLNPPPPNSPYHKFAGLISRIELVDALVCFAYSIWCKDYSRKACLKTWATIESFLSWCKQKWLSDDTVGDREKAFVGLIWMIESFIHARKFTYAARTHLDHEMRKLHAHCNSLVSAAMAAAEQPASGNPGHAGSNSTPPMLPSPVSIGASKSANSTPTGRPEGTPSSQASGPSGNRQTANSLVNGSSADKMKPSPAALAAAANVTATIRPQLVQELRDQSAGVVAASWCMEHSQKTLNLPIMARYFPTTFARMIHSSLLAHEEYEPDIEDEEGELFWPGQCVTGDGLGWVCLMGKAMIKELGKEIGYRGLDGVVPKPKLDEQAEGSSQGPNISVMHR